MEIEGKEEYDAKIQLWKGHDKAVFGRGLGLSTNDRTVSRHHIAFELKLGAKQTEPIGVLFEVLGKNPVWVQSKDDGKIRVFRRSEKGELAAGDWFCVSGKKPAWFVLRDIGVEKGKERLSEDDGIEWVAENSQSRSKLEGFDVSNIDPVKEFGFVVMGHEFDHYPKLMIRDVQRWDWFLEEDVKESEDEEEEKFEKKKKRGVSKRRKRGKDNENDDDEEWTGESEDDKELVRKANNRPKYSTRSKDRDKPQKDNSQDNTKSSQKVYIAADDEEDEMLGGFIVGDDDVGPEEEMNGDDEEEEEFVDDDDDDE